MSSGTSPHTLHEIESTAGESSFVRTAGYITLASLMVITVVLACVGMAYRLQERAAASEQLSALLANTTSAAALPSTCSSGPGVFQRPGDIWTGENAFQAEAEFREHSETNDFRVEGENGFNFWGDPQSANFTQALGRAPLSDQVLAQWVHYFTELDDRLAAEGKTLVVGVAPAKWEIYPENLPAWTAELQGETRLDQFLKHSGEVPFVDVRTALYEAKQQAPVYSAVNSHWAPYGGASAWGQIVKCASELYPTSVWSQITVPEATSVETLPAPNEFTVHGDKSSPTDWAVPVFESLAEVETTRNVGAGETSTSVGGGVVSLLDMPARTNFLGGEGTALIVRDSTGDALDPLWSNAFAKTCQVRHNLDYPNARIDVLAEAESCGADTVLYFFAERYFAQIPPAW